MTKVLLVEDDNNLREIFEMRLQAEGYATVTAGDGEEALTVAMKEKPDLIISDIMMPKLSGFEMLENLRSAPEMKDIKVIMMTALGQAEDRARGDKLGVVKYLVKSQVTLEDFVRVVREVLQPAPAAAPQAAAATGEQTNLNQSTKQESETSPMPEDSQPTSPSPSTPPADSGAPSSSPAPDVGAPVPNPISISPDGDLSNSGQLSSAEEKSSVEGQINDFVASAPAGAPADAPSSDAPADNSSSTDAPAVPPTSAPAPSDPAQPGASPAPGSSSDNSSGL